MAITITPSNVAPTANSVLSQVVAGESVTAGQVVYLDSTTGLYMLASRNGTVDAAGAAGVSLDTASANQPLVVATSGTVELGLVLVAGSLYALSTTAGGIDLYTTTLFQSTEYTTLIGLATSTTHLDVQLFATGVRTV